MYWVSVVYTELTGSKLPKELKGQQGVEHVSSNDLKPSGTSPTSLTANEKAEGLQKKL